MRRIRFVPGNIVAGVNITIPTSAPDIEEIPAVGGAEITRTIDSLVVAHGASITDIAHADGLDVAHAGMVVDDHVFTQPGDHTLNLITPAGGGAIVTLNDGLAIEVVGGSLTDGGATVSAHAAMAVDAHVVSAQSNDHPAADIVDALADHAVAVGLIDHADAVATVAVAAVPTRVDRRTVTLDVNTNLGDMLTLAYQEVGERVLVS